MTVLDNFEKATALNHDELKSFLAYMSEVL